MLRTATRHAVFQPRLFSTTAATQSHVGKALISVPPGVELEYPELISKVKLKDETVPKRILKFIGPLGKLELPLEHVVELHPKGNQLSITVRDNTEKKQKGIWGLTNALINNSLVGVSEGYRTVIRLVGVGYRASVEPIPPSVRELLLRPRFTRDIPPTDAQAPIERLHLKLGYAHPVYVNIPRDMQVSCPQPTRIVLSCLDKHKIGQYAANIRSYRRPEPYRGKVRRLFFKGLRNIVFDLFD